MFLLPFVAESTLVVADEEGRAAFFVPLRQPYPTDSGIRLQLKCIMQTTASIQRTAQLRPLGIGKASIEAWLNAKSKVMTHMFGMEVTRLEGLRVYWADGGGCAEWREPARDGSVCSPGGLQRV